MNRLLGWVQQWVVQIAIGFLFGGCFLRIWIQFADQPNLQLALVLLVLWLVVFITEPWFTKKWGSYFYLYLLIQTALIFTLLFNFPDNDNIAILYAGLSMQIMSRLPPRKGVAIIAIFTPLTILGVRQYYDIAKTIPIAVIYTAANAFLGACAYNVRKAREEREKENILFLELEKANQKLEDSARQAGQLSIARERSRLALELHDSVTQTIFSMVLTTRAAVILAEQDPPRVVAQLDHLDKLVRSALDELKKLVLELKPDATKRESLLGLLQEHVIRLSEDDLQISIQTEGTENLTPQEVQCLFRICQESLNNVIKHAQTKSASIFLKFTTPSLMEIRDRGVGFDTVTGWTGFGLAGMKERAAGIGWKMEIKSHPGEGTLVRVRKN